MIELLKKVPLFINLSDEALEAIGSMTHEKRLPPQKTIFKDGEEADSLYLISERKVQIEKEFKDQRRKVLAILDAGAFFGEMAIITDGFRCASAVTAEETVLISVDKNEFLNHLKANANICFEILQQVCLRLQTADSEIETLAFQNLPGRIATKILELQEQFGKPQPDGSHKVDLELTHANLAEMVGTNRETVSKYISIFRKESAIHYELRQLTVLDPKILHSWC